MADELKTTTPYGNAVKGTEGGHGREFFQIQIHILSISLLSDDTSSRVAVAPKDVTDSTGNMQSPPPILGDWVLFHPV